MTKRNNSSWSYPFEKNLKPKRFNRRDDLPTHLQGPPQNRYGGRQSRRLRAFKGSTFGPANEGRTYSSEEKKTFEAELKRKGIL